MTPSRAGTSSALPALGSQLSQQALMRPAQNTATSTAAPMKDPGEKYPKPPFDKQSQAWPGLAGKMTPRPDHGRKATRAQDA